MRAAVLSLIGIIFLCIIMTFFGSWYTVSQSELGVVTRFGAVTGIAKPGLGFKTPFVTGITKVSLKTQILQLKQVESYSQDQQPAMIALSVNYSVAPGQVEEVYATYGSVDNLETVLIQPRVLQQLKNVFGHYSASTAISSRDKLNADVKEAVADSVKGPVNIEGVQIEDIKFSPSYEQAIEARMQAEVEVQRSKQQADNEKVKAQITVTKAQAEADSQLAVAKAQAQAVQLQGEAAAAAIKAKGDALKDNPNLVSLMAIEKWKGDVPATMVPGSSVPFLGVK